MPSQLAVLAQIASVCLCVVGAVIDLRTRRIPNWLTGSGLMLGLGMGLALGTADGSLLHGGRAGLAPAAAGAVAALLPFAVLAAFGTMGMGDVKLMAAVGALWGWPLALPVVVYTLLAGGVVALVYAIAGGRLGNVLVNVGRLVGRGGVRGEPVHVHRIPYGTAILLGVTWAVLGQHVPSLRLL